MRDNYTGFVFTAAQAVELWKKLQNVIRKFKGDGEKFFSTFFGLMKENLLPDHFNECRITNALMQEVCVAVLNHLSGNKLNDIQTKVKQVTISDKEIKSLEYLAGFVIHKLYKKLKYSKVHASSFYNVQSCFILQACKVESDDSQLLINARDRGGLWRVGKKIIRIFLQFEHLFRSKTSTFVTSLICKEFVKEIMSDIIVMSNFNEVCMSTADPVSKYVQKDLLEQIITLFFRVRTFSFAKNTREQHKMAKKESRKRSLRTEMKKASSSTEM